MSFRSLVSAVSEQCQEIKQAMTLFPYFDTWDGNVITECCRVSSVAEFPPDEIILGPGSGDSQAVHFVLNGVCKMVQHLQVEFRANSPKKAILKLHKPSDSKMPNSEKKDERYLSRMFNQKLSLPTRANCGTPVLFDHTLTERRKQADVTECPSTSNGKAEETEESQEGFSGDENEIERVQFQSEKVNLEDSKAGYLPVEDETEVSKSKKKIIFESDHHLKVLQYCKERRKQAICVLEPATLPEKPANVRSLFIQTGILYTGASFGLGKLGKENFVMSSTAVKILKIPLRLLLQHNPCNIWNRISLFYSLYLFEDEKVFEYYQNDQKWIERKKRQTEEISSLKGIPNYTSISDVPYWIRLSSTR